MGRPFEDQNHVVRNATGEYLVRDYEFTRSLDQACRFCCERDAKISCDDGETVLPVFVCEKCEHSTLNGEDAYGEHVCDDCQSNAAEAAHERMQADFHAGDSGWPKSLFEQQIDAQKLK